jgi:hypothetical protein
MRNSLPTKSVFDFWQFGNSEEGNQALVICPAIHSNEHEHATPKQAYSVRTSVLSGEVTRTLASSIRGSHIEPGKRRFAEVEGETGKSETEQCRPVSARVSASPSSFSTSRRGTP